MSKKIYKWLEIALDYGIKEVEFWDMTIDELGRAIDSKKRLRERDLQEKASFDHILADLIGRSIARLYSSSAKYPEISDIYTTLFDKQEIDEKRKEKIAELSAARFRRFANSFNTKYKEVAKDG